MKVKDAYSKYIPYCKIRGQSTTGNFDMILVNTAYAIELFLYAKYDPFKLVNNKDPMYLWYNQQQLVHYYVDLEKMLTINIFNRYKNSPKTNSLGEFLNQNHSLKDLYNILITDRNKFLEIVKPANQSNLWKKNGDENITDINDLPSWNFRGITRLCLEVNIFWTGIYFMIYKHMVNGLLRANTDYSKGDKIPNFFTEYIKDNKDNKVLPYIKDLNRNMKISRIYNKILDNYKISYFYDDEREDKNSIGSMELGNGKTIKTYYSSDHEYSNSELFGEKYKSELCKNIDNIMKKVLDKTITLRFIINGKAYDAEVEEAKIENTLYHYLKNSAPLYAYYKHKYSDSNDLNGLFFHNNDAILIRPVYKVTKLTDMDGVEQPINLKDAYGIYKVYDAPYNVMDMNDPTKNVVKVSEPNIEHRLYKEDMLDYTLTDYQTIYDDVFDNKDPDLNMKYYQGRHITIPGNRTYDFVTYNTALQFLSEETILKNINTQKLTYKNSYISFIFYSIFFEGHITNYGMPYTSKLKPLEPMSHNNIGQYLDHDFSLNMFDLTPFLSDIQIDMINNSLKKLDKLVIPILCKKNPVYKVDYESIVDDTKEEQDYFLNALKEVKDITMKSDTYNKIDMDLKDLNKKVPYITPNTIRDFDSYIDRLSQIKDNEDIRFNPRNLSNRFDYSVLGNIIDHNKNKHNLHTIGDFKMEDYTDNLLFFDLCAQYAIHEQTEEDNEKDDIISKLLTLMPSKLVPHSIIITNDALKKPNIPVFDGVVKQLTENGIDKNYKTALEYYSMWISNGGG